jgi:serine/threonine protein kinase/tetratricopeptide (TPR) repeat protein
MTERSIFLEASEITNPSERIAYLDRACNGDAVLRQGVEALLDANDRSGSFMRRPAVGDATADHRPAESTGSRIGPYKLLQQIGEGGMGVVYMAEQEQAVRRKVALKIIKPGMDSMAVVARFEAERQALAMMDHTNIARVFDAGTTESGRPYFVMELVHGVPITEYCDANKLTPRERLDLFVPVCQAIQHAHQKGIIHRDVKPSNILVTMYDDKPVPKVIDFGVAKAVEQRLTERTLFTQFGALVGTFEYMSPEQAEMNAFGVDTRSDIYALGVLLYELMTGTTPLERRRLREAALGEIVRLIKEEEPQRPSVRLSTTATWPKVAEARKTEPAKLSRLMRGELDWVVMKCLEKDRSRRYDTASNLARDIDRFLKNEPVEARPPTPGYRLRKAVRRNRTTLTVIGVVTAAVALATAATLWQVSVAQADRERARIAEVRRAEERQQHEEEMAALVRRQALDDAIAAAMSGEQDKAKKAIHDAELKGVSPGQVHWLQGLVHYQRGEFALAIEEFEQARKLMPESVAPVAMIARANSFAGFHNGTAFGAKFRQAIEDMGRMTPTTPEDYLCRGYASGLIEQKQPIEDMDRAIEMRDSPIGRVFRSSVLTRVAADTADLDLIRRAQEDLKRARVLLPDNAFVGQVSLYTQLHAANLYARTGQVENRKRVMEQAKEDAEFLRNFPIAVNYTTRYQYFLQSGDDAAALAVLQKAADRQDSRELSYRYALALYQRGKIEDAVKALERRNDADDDASNVLRIFLTAEQSEEGHRKAYEDLVELAARRRRESGQPIGHFSAPAAMLFLGKRPEAVQLADGNAGLYVGPRHTNFLANKASEQEYLDQARDSRYLQCGAHYWVGMVRLSEGDRNGAREAFKASVDTGLWSVFYHTHSQIMLARLESDPAWPRWIKGQGRQSSRQAPFP